MSMPSMVSTTSPAAARASAEDLARSLAALEELLDRFVDVLMGLDADTYGAVVAPGVSGSIGGHTRHALDHVSALLGSSPAMSLSYDHRERGTAVELDPSAALRQILRLKAALRSSAATRSPDEPLWVVTQVSVSGAELGTWSSFARELAFVMNHTIHHQALVALLLAMQGYEVPARFGYAPSTPGR
jgi:hypothetical protein